MKAKLTSNEQLHALQHTTHPSAFQIPAIAATEALRNHSHPNFIRWSTINGNRPRILFGRILGGLNILFGFIIAILLLLSTASRWWRIWAFPIWFLGFAFLLAGANGICLVLYVTKDRHIRPWEQHSNNSESTLNTINTATTATTTKSSGRRPSGPFEFDGNDDETTLAGSDVLSLSQPEKPLSQPGNTDFGKKSKRNVSHRAGVALEAFGTANSYGHEVWVEKYRAKMMLRKIFDRTIWVANENVRIVQDRVALQAVCWALIASVPLTIIFTAVPRVGAYH